MELYVKLKKQETKKERRHIEHNIEELRENPKRVQMTEKEEQEEIINRIIETEGK